jgi:hypothetical protein
MPATAFREKDFGFGELTAKTSGLTPESFATTL